MYLGASGTLSLRLAAQLPAAWLGLVRRRKRRRGGGTGMQCGAPWRRRVEANQKRKKFALSQF